MAEQHGEIVTAGQPAGGRCRVCLDVRPFGFTLLAQVSWDGEAEVPSPEGLVLVGLVEQVLEELRQQDAERARVEEENARLRQALEACVSACGRFLGNPSDEVPLDAFEADRALAHQALEEARRALAGPPAVVVG